MATAITGGLAAALTQIDAALSENIARTVEIQQRVRHFADRLADGESIRALVEDEAEPRTVELLTHNMAVLETVGADFRIELARALRAEGLTLEAIASLFGVTRQRISALLRQRV